MIEGEKHLATDETLIKHGSDINSERWPANQDAVLAMREYAFAEGDPEQDYRQTT